MKTRAPSSSAALAAVGCLAFTSAPAAAQDGVELDWRGFVMTDLRLFADEGLAFERSETTASVRLGARLDPHVSAVGDIAVVFTEASRPTRFSDLTDREAIDPLRWEQNALFVELVDVPEGLDIRLGRQTIIWGSADRFHPVSNLNPLDVEDPTAFGAVLPNEMVSLDLRPDWSAGCDDDEEPWLDELRLQLVFVPFFKPAQLPASAGLAFTDKRVFRERATTPLTQDLVAKQDVLERTSGWEFRFAPRVTLPERTLDNSMFGARLAARLVGIDLGLTWFSGFDDFPRAERIVADTSGIPTVDVDLELTYPRVQVVGLDMATSLDFLDGLGLWAEVAVTFHDALYRIVSTGAAIGVNAVERELAADAFVKAVVGVDYTPVPWLYLNVQYLHGFVDEFGADQLEDYLVAGADIKIDNDRFLLRFFNIFNLQDGSFVLYPRFTVRPWQSGELSLGAFIYSSSFSGFDETTKFDSRASGSSTVFLQAKASL